MAVDNVPVLAVDKLSKRFFGNSGIVDAVDNVSFKIYEGECAGLIGESGSGKSTIAALVAGLLPSDGGTVNFLGKRLSFERTGRQQKLYRKLQMIFQNPLAAFNPRYRMADNVAEGLRYYERLPVRRLRELALSYMEMCGLTPEDGDKYPWQLSGGECQRAAIARAIISQPKLLICDEITSALDVSIQKQILDLLADLQKQLHMSCLFISHDLAVVSQFCQRVMVMHDGRLVESGPVADIIGQPQNAYTKRLLDSALTVGVHPA